MKLWVVHIHVPWTLSLLKVSKPRVKPKVYSYTCWPHYWFVQYFLTLLMDGCTCASTNMTYTIHTVVLWQYSGTLSHNKDLRTVRVSLLITSGISLYQQKCAIWIIIWIAQFNYHSNCAIWIIIRMTVFWTMCMPNHIAMRNLECDDGPDHHLNCAFQITHRDVILCTHGPKYRHSNDHSNCTIRIKIQITHFCSRVKTVTDSQPWGSQFETADRGSSALGQGTLSSLPSPSERT